MLIINYLDLKKRILSFNYSKQFKRMKVNLYKFNLKNKMFKFSLWNKRMFKY